MKSDLIDKIVLTLEEEREAIYEGKVRKYFKEKHGKYWEEKEKIKRYEPNTKAINQGSKRV